VKGAFGRECVAAALAVLLFGPHAARATHIDLEVALDPAARIVSGKATLRFEANEPRRFALASEAVIAQAQAGGREIELVQRARDGRLVYDLPATVGERSVSVVYRLALAPLDDARDHRGVLAGLPAMAAATGSFLPAGSGWYPEPEGDFSYTVSVSVPPSQRAIVPGRLASESESGGAYRARFEFPHPAAGIDLMAGPYVVRERVVRVGSRDLRLRTYFAPDLGEALADDYLAAVERYLRLYSDSIGEYPFDGFSVVSGPLPTGFGMPTLTYLGAQVIRLPFIRDTSLGHEVLHNWWGNCVYPDYARGNWSEGLTTFMADYAYKERAGAARDMRLGWLRDFAALPAGEDKPLAAFTSRTHSASAAVGYGKAAMVFSMVREQIGAQAFDRGIRAFYREHQFKRASWGDLEAAFSKASGQSLAARIEPWLVRTGAPRISVSSPTAQPAGSGWRLSLTLTQGTPPYVLAVPLRVRTDTGEETVLGSLSQARQAIVFELKGRPLSVAVDPEFQLWRQLAPGEAPPILREAIAARNPVLVIASDGADFKRAAQGLAGAFLERPARIAEAIPAGTPLAILMGTPESVETGPARCRLGASPDPPREPGTARAWTQRCGDQTVVVIVAKDADALANLARALPHLGGQSWAVFEGPRPVARGIWPPETPTVPVRIAGDR
jgi:aminopeptidase N